MTDFVAGLTQATLVTIVGYPFDLVKTRMQSGMYKTSFDCVVTTVKTEGPLALYRGAASPFVSHSIKRPIQFLLAENYKKKIESINSTGALHNVPVYQLHYFNAKHGLICLRCINSKTMNFPLSRKLISKL